MELRLNKDKKMADVLEALSGAVMQASGLIGAHVFLRKIGVLQINY